jgi:TPR repeat protein
MQAIAEQPEIERLRAAAEQGDALAQLDLGARYYEGRGIARDDAEAAKWFRRAALQGLAPAQFNLGNMYAVGLGVPKDLATAYIWLNVSAARGDDAAAKARDLVAGEMTLASIAEARRLSSERRPRTP